MSFLYNNDYADRAYYTTLLRAYSSSISDNALKASAFYINNEIIKHKFMKEIDELCINKYRTVQDSYKSHEEKIIAINELKKEDESLKNEYMSMINNYFVRYLYIELEEREKIRNWIIKGAAFVGGIGQVALGTPLMFAPPGYTFGAPAYGFLLVSHGMNNIYESIQYFQYNNADASGYVRDFYRGASNMLGFNDTTGDKIYVSVDFLLSMKGVFGKYPIVNNNSLNSTFKLGPFILKNYDSTHTGRLFRALEADFKIGLSSMSKPAIIIETFNDALNLKVLFSQ
ncbi:DUF4225 domain-containing protein [Proteus terrae]|uniref:DUF4225 domain-containing protein n=1 Tax=Proteus terrae TaxID=1574161 RepID=UPI00288AA200|nr:DUF4225 domain-containing protein [Proteus terrae]